MPLLPWLASMITRSRQPRLRQPGSRAADRCGVVVRAVAPPRRITWQSGLPAVVSSAARPSGLMPGNTWLGRRRADRVDRHLDVAVGAVLDADRHRQRAAQLPVHLARRRAGADRAPGHDVGDELRRDRVEELAADRQARARRRRAAACAPCRRPVLTSKVPSRCGSLIRPFQPSVVRGFSKYTRITTCRSSRELRRPWRPAAARSRARPRGRAPSTGRRPRAAGRPGRRGRRRLGAARPHGVGDGGVDGMVLAQQRGRDERADRRGARGVEVAEAAGPAESVIAGVFLPGGHRPAEDSPSRSEIRLGVGVSAGSRRRPTRGRLGKPEIALHVANVAHSGAGPILQVVRAAPIKTFAATLALDEM